MRALYRLVTFLRQNPDRWIQVDAFSETGDLPAQRERAQERADDVKSFLVENGVNGGRILALGYDSRLAAEEGGRPERVEITVLHSGVRPVRRGEPA